MPFHRPESLRKDRGQSTAISRPFTQDGEFVDQVALYPTCNMVTAWGASRESRYASAGQNRVRVRRGPLFWGPLFTRNGAAVPSTSF